MTSPARPVPMTPAARPAPHDPSRTVRAAVVLRPGELACEVLLDGETASAGYGRPFGSRADSLTPGHLVAVTTDPDGQHLVLWRWYDAVVVEQSHDQLRLWEPNHGEVLATPRDPDHRYLPGTRAYASAGLPGADWWVEGAAGGLGTALDEVCAFYAAHDLWDRLA